ncbi:O-Methyltransferase involved in polyketide biosynthesis [Minicystis rosea]|nr:O-Methyltransferase involved in polyketide biosynthesis [Minicystis rosea]
MPASKTAEYVALYRALETTERSRTPLFQDPFASRFLSRGLRLALGLSRSRRLRAALVRYSEWRAPGARTSAIGRTRFIDDTILRAVQNGVRQIVLLGAGYDCRAHRMPELRDARVFEVDREDTQAVKRRRVGTARGTGNNARVTYVPVDFVRDDLERCLERAGWSAGEPSVFVWEGVTNYLTERAVADVLRFIGSAAAGTVLIFTYIHRGVIDGTVRFAGGDKLVRQVAKLGEPWRFGLLPSEAPAFVRRFGLSLEEDMGADEYRRRYLGDDAGLDGYAFYRIAVARVG